VANFSVVSAQRNSCKTPFRVRFKDLSIGNIRTLFYKIREYVDDLKAKERKEKASHSRKPTEI
jgi:hypothetical protein